MTSRTSAHLAPLCDDFASEIISLKGLGNEALLRETGAAESRIKEIQKKATSAGSTVVISSKGATCQPI